MTGRSAGRRGFLMLAGAAALLPGARRAAAEATIRDAPIIPAPAGLEARPVGDARRDAETRRLEAEGFEVIAFFVTTDARPFTLTVFRPPDPARDAVAEFREALEALRGRLPTLDGPDDGPRAFERFADLRFERQIVADDAFLWLGSWSGDVSGEGEAGLAAEGLLRLDGRILGFRAHGARQPGETAAPAGPRPADGGVAVSESPGGGVIFSPAEPLPPSERRSLAADAGLAWIVLDAWVDAVRVANGLPALTVHDVAGVAITVPAPEGFVRRPTDPQLGPLDARYPDIDFVAAGETAAPADRTFIAVSPRGTVLAPAVTRPEFDAMLLQLRVATAATPAYTGGTGSIHQRIGTAESPDSFAMLFLGREAPEQGGSGTAYLYGQAHIWASGVALAVLMTSRTMAESDGAILRAWQVFRDWVAAVAAANGGQ